jgi:uncharacterized membrane protein
MMEWELIGKIWVLLLGATIVFEMYKWIIKKIKK